MKKNEELLSMGKNLISEIKEKKIIKDHRPNTGKDFRGGYEELYLYKFKKYQSSVGKYIRDTQLKEVPYDG